MEWTDLRELADINIHAANIDAKWHDQSGKLISHSVAFRGDRTWREGSIAISNPGEGHIALQFAPSGVIAYIRCLRFITEDRKTLPVKLAPTDFAYRDRLPDGTIRLAAHSEGPHFGLSLPPGGASGEFRFEIMIDYSVRSLSWVLQQTSAEVLNRRKVSSQPWPTKR